MRNLPGRLISLQLIIIKMILYNYIRRKCTGGIEFYKITKDKPIYEYINDTKSFVKKEKVQETLRKKYMNNTSKDVGRECTMLIIKKWEKGNKRMNRRTA